MECPVAHGLTPLSPEYWQDPYSQFARLRAHAPIVYVPELDHYVVTRYDEIVTIFKDRVNFSARNVHFPMMTYVPEAQRILDDELPRVPTFSNADPPQHTKIRGATMKVLNTRRFRKPAAEIRALAEQLVDAAVRRPVFDMVSEIAFPLAGFAAARLVGFSLEDMDQIKAWSDRRVLMAFGYVPPEAQVAGARAMVEF